MTPERTGGIAVAPPSCPECASSEQSRVHGRRSRGVSLTQDSTSLAAAVLAALAEQEYSIVRGSYAKELVIGLGKPRLAESPLARRSEVRGFSTVGLGRGRSSTARMTVARSDVEETTRHSSKLVPT